EPAACNNNRVAPVRCWPIGKTVQMPVEGDRVSELVNAEAMLETRDLWTEEPTAGRHNHPMVGKTLLGALGRDDLHGPGFGVDRLCAALHVDDIDGFEDIQQRRGQGLWLRLVESGANDQRRLRRDQRDLKFFR